MAGRAPRWPALLAWLVAAFVLFVPIVVTVWLELRLRASGTSFLELNDESAPAGVLWLLAWVGYPIVGAIIVMRRRENRIGWLAAGLGLLIAGLGALDGYSRAGAELGMPGVVWSGWITGVVGPTAIGLVVLLLATFPTGHIRRPLPRWFAPSVVGATATVLVAKGLRPGMTDVELPNPIQLPVSRAALEAVVIGATWILVVAGLAALIVLIWAFRRSTGVERLQLRWFVTPLVVLPVAMPLIIVVEELGSLPEFLNEYGIAIAFVVTFLGNAAGIGIAVTRHGLYEIDRVISRTVAWLTVTVLLLAGYAGTVLVLQAGLRAVGAPDSDLVVAASTLLMAAAARPLFHGVRQVVDRRFNRTTYDATSVVGALSASLRDEVAPESVRSELVRTVTRSLQPAAVWTWMPEDGISPRRTRA